MTHESNKSDQSRDLHQITHAELEDFLGCMTVSQARSFIPEFRKYYQARKQIWNAIRLNKELEACPLETEANNAIFILQTKEWSKTELEQNIIDIFTRIKEQEEIIRYEIEQELSLFE